MQNNVFNEGIIDYDNVIDLFYSWLFSRLHFLITKYAMNANTQQKVLDIGCGTGFQSFLYAHYGSSVVGIDISDVMIRQAMNKCKKHLNSNYLILFPECFGCPGKESSFSASRTNVGEVIFFMISFKSGLGT